MTLKVKNINFGSEFDLMQPETADGTLRLKHNGIDALKINVNNSIEVIHPKTLAESFINATYQNGWTSYGGSYYAAGYYKDPYGIVHLRGLVRNGTIPSTVFTLPVGYRPEYRELIRSISASLIARVDVTAGGAVIAQAGNTGWVSLDNISFRAAL